MEAEMTKRLVGAAGVQEGSDPVLDLKPARVRFPIVGIGASAGGLEAVGKLLDALPGDSGMAFIMIQHLDPTHASTMASLLAGLGSSRVDLQACKLEYSIVSPK